MAGAWHDRGKLPHFKKLFFMGASGSIQFRGRDNVIQAYNDRDVQVWSLWQGKQMLTKGNDADSLTAFINMLEQSESAAIYTVRVYEDIEDVKKVKSNTPDDGSFNFRLNEPDQLGYNKSGGGGGIGSYGIQRRFDELEEKIAGFIDSQNAASVPEEEEEETITTAIIGLLKDPDKLEKVVNLGRSLFSDTSAAVLGNVQRIGGGGNTPNEQRPAASQPSLSPSSSTQSKEQRLIRLGAAIDILEQNDELIVEHLERLAKIAKDSPRQFSQLITMLDVL
jgi:hypothetical protein